MEYIQNVNESDIYYLCHECEKTLHNECVCRKLTLLYVCVCANESVLKEVCLYLYSL
jgi:hypothetical protein